MKHRGSPNVHEIIVQNFRNPHELKNDLQFIRDDQSCYIQSNVMVSLSLMTIYIKHLRYLAKAKHFGPFYYVQIDPQDYDEWRIKTPEEEIHFQTPSKLGSPATPRSMATSQTSESYITLNNFKKGIKRDASAYPIFKNERYYNTFIRHFKATAKAQGLSTLMDPNFTPGSDEYEQQLFQEQQDFLYSVLISSLKTDFSEALVKDHEGDAQLILELLHEHHTGNSQYSRSEINRITKYLTNIKLDDTWRGTNESFLMHYNDQLRLLDSLVDSDEKLPDNTRVTFLESAVESVPDLRRVKITDNVLQAQLDSTRPISYRSYFDLLRDAAFHLDQATKRGNKIRRTNVHFSGPNDEDEHQNLSSDDPQVIQQEDVSSEPPEPLSYSVFQSHFQGSSTSNTQKIFLPKPIWEKLSKDQQQMIIDHNRSLPKRGSSSFSTPNKSPSPLPHKPTPIDAYTKRQSTVETATFGSEFVAARTAVDQIIDIRTTLRYFGVPIRDKSYMFGDNRSVVTSSTIPNSTISKRHHLASYHRVSEAIAAKFISFHWKDGKSNLLTFSANIGSLQLSGLCSSLSCSGGARPRPS